MSNARRSRFEPALMPKKLWKIHLPLKLRYPGTGIFEMAAADEIVEERTEPTDSPDDVRVYRLHKDHNDFHSFIVSRSELSANAKVVNETEQA